MSTATPTRWSRPSGDTVAVTREQCVFRAAVQFAEKAEEGKPFGLRIRANSGEPMPHWFWGTVVVDLSGVRWTRADLPILLDHFTSRIVGYTNQIALEDGEGLVAQGVLSKKTEDGRYVRELAEEGFPWQASVMLEIESIEDVGDGVSVEVNGFTLQGPAVVLRKTRLREVTVTTLGADENTDAELFGDRGKGPIVSNVIRAAAEPQGEAAKNSAPPPEARFSQGEVDGAVKAAVAAENARVAKILEGAGTDQRTLAAELIAKGTPADEALLALIKGRTEANTAKLAQIAAETPGPLGPDPKQLQATSTQNPSTPRAGSISAADREKRRAEQKVRFSEDASLRDRFPDSEAYVNFCELSEHREIGFSAVAKGMVS